MVLQKTGGPLSESELASLLPIPKKGEVVNGKRVLGCKIQDAGEGFYTVGIRFEKGTKAKDIPAMLMPLFNTHHISSSKGDYTVENKDYQIRPHKGTVQIIYAMQLVPAALSNPSKKLKLTPLEDFDKHYTKMAIDTPEQYFRVFDYRGFNGPAFRAKLWSFVGYMGENYGYCDDKHIYHRRASLVMPKIKITKAPTVAKMMYHTHPRKDEPSLSSADDFLLYFDLSMPPRSIRHFYTVMANRMDHFHITSKKNAKGKYVRVNEDKFIEELDKQMTVFEEKHDAKFKKDDDNQDLKFCEAVTKDVVKWLNKKYGAYVKIKYKCYYKVKKNPPEPEFGDLHLGDEFIAKAIQDIRDGKYSWPTFETDKKPHESYAYWFTQYYFMEDNRDRQAELLTRQDGNKAMIIDQGPLLRVLNNYLDTVAHPEYSHNDLLNLLTLNYDIMRIDAKVRDGHGMKSRIEDLARELALPNEVKDNLIMLEEARSVGVDTPEAQTLSGDYYPILVLSNLAIEAVETMQSVTNGLMTLEQAKHEVYATKKNRAIAAIDEALTDQKVQLNPPPQLSQANYTAFIPPEYLGVTGIVEEALETFAPYAEGKAMINEKGSFSLRVPVQGVIVSIALKPTTGTMQIFSQQPVSENHGQIATLAYEKVVNRLNEYGLSIPTDDLEVGTVAVSNPRMSAQLIIISGASGSGKSTTIRNLLKALPKSKTVPTYTTRQKRKSDKVGEKVFISEKQFKEMLDNNDFAESTRQKSGNLYGRRLEDFKGDFDYIIIDANPSGVNRLKTAFPNAFTIYLETTAKPEDIYQILLRRGQMSPQEAKKRASFIPNHIKDSKKMNFDLRLKSIVGKYDSMALEILDKLPKVNPPKILTPADLRKRPKTLFVFGDNDMRTGKGGQAVNRDESNAVGFRTKHKPTTSADAYYSDDNYTDNIRKMQEDLDNIKRLSGNYDSVYFMPGIGEGRALLKEKAPKTYKWMKDNLPKNNPDEWEPPTKEDIEHIKWVVEGPPSILQHPALDVGDNLLYSLGAPKRMKEKVWQKKLKEAGVKNPPKITSVVNLIHPLDKKEIVKRYDSRVKRWLKMKKKNKKPTSYNSTHLAKVRKVYNWRGRTGESLFQAVAKQIDSEIKGKDTVKVYRAAIMMPLDDKELRRDFRKIGLGVCWSTYKEGADVYVPGKKGYQAMYGAKQFLMEGEAHISSINWLDTFTLSRLGFPEEREINMKDDIIVKRIDIYSLDQKASDKYLKWETTGKNWKPWIDPSIKPERVIKLNKMFPTDTKYFQSTPLNPPQHELSIIYGEERENPTDGTHYWTKEDEAYHAEHHEKGHQIHEPSRQASGCVVTHDGKYLIMRRSPEEDTMVGIWEFPAGKIESEDDGSPLENALRETEEEAGLEVDIIEPLGEHITDGKVITAFLATSETPEVTLSHEHDAYKWVTLDEALSDYKLGHHTIYFFERLKVKDNPPKLIVRIEESTKSEKKLMAVFTKPNGRTKTTHFGARGMSDYTQHKDPKRMKNYLARHGGMGEDWNDPTSAGALSRWILWGKPSLRESFNDYKKRFNIEGVMAVTNTKMNPPYTTKFDFVPGKDYTFDELPGDETGRIITAFEEDYGPLGTSLKEDAIHHFRSKEEGGYGWPGKAEDATYRAVIIPVDELVEKFGHLKGKPSLQKHIEKYGLDYPSIGNEGNNRRTAMAQLKRPMPHLEVIPTKQNPGWRHGTQAKDDPFEEMFAAKDIR